MAKKKAGPPPSEPEYDPNLKGKYGEPDAVRDDETVEMTADNGTVEVTDDTENEFEEIKIENVGEIEYAVIPIPKKGGGVLVLEGDNGTGKSTALGIINALITKTGKLVPRDLADQGSVTGFDRKIRVAGTTTRSGDGEVNTIDPGKFDFGDLIDPPFVDAEPRNNRRIQALIGLSSAAPKLELFIETVGGKPVYDSLLTPKDQAIRDPVQLAAKLKAALDAKARDEETLNANDVNTKAACEAAAKDIDIMAPSDAKVLQDQLVEAANALSRLQEQRTSYIATANDAIDAQVKIDEHAAGATERMALLKSHRATATDEVEIVDRTIRDSNERIERLKAELLAAQTEGTRLASKRETAVEKLQGIVNQIAEAELNAKSVAGWQETVTKSKEIKNPTDEAIAEAEAKVTAARDAVDLGSKVRTAIEKLDEAKKLAAVIKERAKQAAKLRDKAAAVFGALSKMIPTGPLYVVGGQLVVDTHKRKAEPYQRLSDGERWFLALPYAIKAVGSGGYITAPQAAWQDISETHKPKVAAMCEAAEVWLITGQVSTGPLRSHAYVPPAGT